MKKLNESRRVSRRNFCFKILPTTAFACLGYQNVLAHSVGNAKKRASQEAHKWEKKHEFSYEQLFNQNLKLLYIPHMEYIAKEIGRERLINILKKIATELYVDPEFEQLMQKYLPPDLWEHAVSKEVVKMAETEMIIKYTECLWAKTFREANAADIGYASHCYVDYATMAKRGWKLTRPKTLMQGDDHCYFHMVKES